MNAPIVPIVQISYPAKTKFYAELNREIEAFADPIWFTAIDARSSFPTLKSLWAILRATVLHGLN